MGDVEDDMVSELTPVKLWLWRNGDHYWAFDKEYPCYEEGGDPMTLGEPVGWAWLWSSHNA
jgi:hypothetical protein